MFIIYRKRYDETIAEFETVDEVIKDIKLNTHNKQLYDYLTCLMKCIEKKCVERIRTHKLNEIMARYKINERYEEYS